MRVRISQHTVEGYEARVRIHEFGVWLVHDAGERYGNLTIARGNRTLLGWGSEEEKEYALELALKDWRHHRQNRRKP
jgi:hypothetical protein